MGLSGDHRRLDRGTTARRARVALGTPVGHLRVDRGSVSAPGGQEPCGVVLLGVQGRLAGPQWRAIAPLGQRTEAPTRRRAQRYFPFGST